MSKLLSIYLPNNVLAAGRPNEGLAGSTELGYVRHIYTLPALCGAGRRSQLRVPFEMVAVGCEQYLGNGHRLRAGQATSRHFTPAQAPTITYRGVLHVCERG